MSDRITYPYAILILDACASGTERDRTLPGGAPRYRGARYGFADGRETFLTIARALGIADDASVLITQGLECVQVPTAPLRRARIDPVFQFVNDREVFSGRNAQKPLEALRDACLAARQTTSRAFLLDLSALTTGSDSS